MKPKSFVGGQVDLVLVKEKIMSLKDEDLGVIEAIATALIALVMAILAVIACRGKKEET